MKNKSEAGQALQELIEEVGILKQIHTDETKELTLSKWKVTCRDANITMTQTKPDSPWQNRTEIKIRELKCHVRRLMARTNTPTLLWYYCCQYAVDLQNRLARPLPRLNGRTPQEVITGNTPDTSIAEYLEFMWYEPVWYYEPGSFPEEKRHVAYWLGVAHRVGQAMCYWALPSTGKHSKNYNLI